RGETRVGIDLDELEKLATVYASFIDYGFVRSKGAFRNFMGFDREWKEEVGSNDSQGRTLWALGATATRAPWSDFRKWSSDLYLNTLPQISKLDSLRTWSFGILGICEFLNTYKGHKA